MSVLATTAFLKLIQDAAGSVKVVQSERRMVDVQAAEPERPYIRVTFVSEGGKTNVPGKKRALAVVELFAKSFNEAWAKADSLSGALGLNGLLCAPPRPNPVDSYSMEQAGWLRGADPQDGGHVYCNLVFFYFE